MQDTLNTTVIDMANSEQSGSSDYDSEHQSLMVNSESSLGFSSNRDGEETRRFLPALKLMYPGNTAGTDFKVGEWVYDNSLVVSKLNETMHITFIKFHLKFLQQEEVYAKNSEKPLKCFNSLKEAKEEGFHYGWQCPYPKVRDAYDTVGICSIPKEYENISMFTDNGVPYVMFSMLLSRTAATAFRNVEKTFSSMNRGGRICSFQWQVKAVLKEGTSGSYPVPVIGRFQPNSREFIDKIISSSGISL